MSRVIVKAAALKKKTQTPQSLWLTLRPHELSTKGHMLLIMFMLLDGWLWPWRKGPYPEPSCLPQRRSLSIQGLFLPVARLLSSGSDSSDSSGSSSDDSDSDSENSEGEQKSGTKSSNMQSSTKKSSQTMHSGNLASGTSLLSNSSHTSSNNMKNSSSSQLKGQSHMSTKTLSNNNSASSQPNALVTGSTTHSQQNNIEVRNDLMPSSTALGNNKSGPGGALPSNTKQQHSNNSYQGNNGIQTPTGSKSSASSLLASS